MIDLGNWLDESHRIPADEPGAESPAVSFPEQPD
jgi:endogenous inhibitor of DNA gyrase (YacG/DUF329 family)